MAGTSRLEYRRDCLHGNRASSGIPACIGERRRVSTTCCALARRAYASTLAVLLSCAFAKGLELLGVAGGWLAACAGVAVAANRVVADACAAAFVGRWTEAKAAVGIVQFLLGFATFLGRVFQRFPALQECLEVLL